MKLCARIVKPGLCNFEGGLRNSEDKFSKAGGRLCNWCCESLQRDGESLRGDGCTGAANL